MSISRNIYGPTPVAHSLNIPEGYELVVTLGDLQGNPMILVEALIHYGLMVPHDDTAHKDLANAYLRFLDADLTYNPNQIFECLKRFTFRNKNQYGQSIVIRLIGDTLCDRGNLDYPTLLIFQQMHLANISFSINIFNHDIEFLNAIFLRLNKFYEENEIYPEALVTNVELHIINSLNDRISTEALNEDDKFGVIAEIFDMRVTTEYPFPTIKLCESVNEIHLADQEIYIAIEEDDEKRKKNFLHYCLKIPNQKEIKGSIDREVLQRIFSEENSLHDLEEDFLNKDNEAVLSALRDKCNQILFATDYPIVEGYDDWFKPFKEYIDKCYYYNLDENKITNIAPQDSLAHFFRMLNAFEGDVQNKMIKEVRFILKKVFLPRLNFVDYEYDEKTAEYTLFLHAPVGPEVIKALAETFNLPYDDSTPENLIASIDRINDRRLVYGKTLKSDLIALNRNSAFHRLVWERYNEKTQSIDVDMPHVINGYKVNYVHGHDHHDSTEYVRAHIKQIDTEIGKVSYPEDEARQYGCFDIKAPHEHISIRRRQPKPTLSKLSLFTPSQEESSSAVTPLPKPDTI